MAIRGGMKNELLVLSRSRMKNTLKLVKREKVEEIYENKNGTTVVVQNISANAVYTKSWSNEIQP